MEQTKKGRFSLSRMDMTSGNLFLKILLFSLPLGLTTVLQLLYTSVDLITVSQGESDVAAASIGATNALINLIVIVFQATSLGSNTLLAQAKGANDHERAEKILHTSVLLSLVFGVFVAVVGFFLAPYMLVWMGTEEHYISNATTYLEIYFIGLPALMVYNYCAQMLRAEGDATTPFLALFVSGLTNVALDCLFVFSFHMGVAGVAYATIIAEGVSALVVVLGFILNKKSYVRLSWKKLRPDWGILGEILRIGIPAGLQRFFFAMPNIFVQSALYTIDPGNEDLETGAIMAGNIEGYVYAMIEGLTLSCLSFTAQNYGAKKSENIKKVLIYAEIWGLIYCALAALVIGVFSEPLLRLLVNTDEAVASGQERLYIMIFPYALNSIFQISAGSMRGQKHSVYPMITVMMCSTVVRIIYIYALFYQFEYFQTVGWLYFLYPLSWGLNTVCNLIGCAIIIPKTVRLLNKEKEASLQVEN